MSNSSPPPTLKALAAALNLSTRRISQLRLEGMPCDSIASAVQWRQSNCTSGDSAEKLRQERILLVREQRTAREIENQRLRRELVSAGQVIEDIARVVAASRGEFLKMASDLPPRLDGLPPAKMQPIIRQAVIDVLTRLSDETSTLYSQ